MKHYYCVMGCGGGRHAHQSAGLMSLRSIGGVGAETVEAVFVSVPSYLEIFCLQVLSPLVRVGIGYMRSVPGGSCRGTAPGAVKVWPSVQNDLMSNSVRPLFPPSRIGANPSPRYDRILSAIIDPFSPTTMSLCGAISSASGSGGGGPQYQTLSADQCPAECVGSGIYQCWS